MEAKRDHLRSNYVPIEERKRSRAVWRLRSHAPEAGFELHSKCTATMRLRFLSDAVTRNATLRCADISKALRNDCFKIEEDREALRGDCW
jgi:hypothetical protein